MRSEERKVHDEFVEKMRDPWWFVPRLTIQTKNGKTRRIDPLFPEQEQCIDAFSASNAILVEKPRQVGSTTIWVALFFWMMMTCGDSYDVLAVMHEYASVGRFTRQIRRHIDALPRFIRPRVLLASDKQVRIKVGRAESSFCTTMAGGRSQGRSMTFRGGLLSEVGRYPRGSSAQGGNAGVDEEAYASIDDTMPKPHVDPLVRLVMESTPGAPVGLFYNLVKHMHGGDKEVAEAWRFLFFPWFQFPQYAMPWKGGELTAEERVLMDKHGKSGMTLDNIQFRRYQLNVKRRTPRTFRTEYPSSWDEPFMIVASMWFDLERIAKMVAAAPPAQAIDGLRVYQEFDPNYQHWLGVDASGGTGGDDACITVTRDDAQIVAVWSSNQVSPTNQAEEAARLSARYGNAVANVEVGNKWGRAVWQRCRELGVPLWVDEFGKDFVTDDRTKNVIMDWMRQLVEANHVRLNDRALLEQCNHIREQQSGRIEADVGYHDDMVVSAALGLWAGRVLITQGWQKKPPPGRMDQPETWTLAGVREQLEAKMVKGGRGGWRGR